MPAMPKPKAATVVSVVKNNFSDLKLKELSAVPATMNTSVKAGVVNEQLANSSAQHCSNAVCGCSNGTETSIAGQSAKRHILRSECYANEHLPSLSSRVDSLTSPLKVSNDEENTRERQNHQCYQTMTNKSSLSNENGKNKTANTPFNNNYNCLSKDSGISTSSSKNGISIVGNCSNTQSFDNKVPVVTTPPKKSPKDYIFGRYIGEGSFSNVYLAVDVHTHNEFAIKVCDKRHILREKKQEYIRREREVMHMMTNVPGFVNLSCTFQDARSLYFVMTYAINGDLLPFINRVGSFDVDCARHYAAELLLACEQMHSRNIIHRDLKPENILLDENMHTLIADFGSAKILNSEEREIEFAKLVELSNQQKEQRVNEKVENNCNDTRNNGNKTSSPTRKHRNKLRNNRNSSARNENDYDENSVDDVSSSNDTGSDDIDSPERDYYNSRRRRYSFVGTAQYVSPEVLRNGPITPSADLWALGCIVYQMISGLPPFRGPNEFVIFREILKGQLHFPQGFDKDAEDLVRKLLQINPAERLGALDAGNLYTSIRSHAFFKNINFENVRKLKPPPICPYLPGVLKDEDFRATIHTLEPGLDDRQLTRLMGIELGTTFGEDAVDSPLNSESNKPEVNTLTNGSKSNAPKNSFDMCNSEKQRRLEQQMFDKWHVFTNNEVILKQGYVNKRKGLFARKRMLLLTTGPHLVYIDPVQMIKKGEIPWSAELRVEAKNFKIFLVHTPNRTYYLDDPEGYSLQWVDAIDKMHELTYKSIHTTESSDGTSTATAVATATTNTSALKTTENSHMAKASSSLSTTTTLVELASTSPLSSPNRCGVAVHRKSTSTSN